VNILHHKNVEVRKARNGNGLFAKRDFMKDEDIFEVKGSFVSGDVGDDVNETERNNTLNNETPPPAF
jgi:hypothetical protein